MNHCVKGHLLFLSRFKYNKRKVYGQLTLTLYSIFFCVCTTFLFSVRILLGGGKHYWTLAANRCQVSSALHVGEDHGGGVKKYSFATLTCMQDFTGLGKQTEASSYVCSGVQPQQHLRASWQSPRFSKELENPRPALHHGRFSPGLKMLSYSHGRRAGGV